MRGTATYTHTHKKRVKIEKPLWDLSWGFFPLPARCEQSQGLQHPENAPPKPHEEHKKQGQSSGGARPRLPFPPQLAVPAAAQWPFVSQPISGVPRILLPLTSRK